MCCSKETDNPLCKEVLQLAAECCYKNAKPWPPIPKPAAAKAPAVPLLDEMPRATKIDNCTLRQKSPFSSAWVATSVMCAHLRTLSPLEAFREWVLHHKCAPCPFCCRMHALTRVDASSATVPNLVDYAV